MRKNSTGVLMGFLFALALLLSIGVPSQAVAALSNDDCVKCHEKPPADIAAAGLAHQEQGCLECHKGHKPTSPKNIPACSECHDGEGHYQLPNCLSCHKNPHTPRVVSFTGALTDPCLTCHKDQIAQLKEFPSKHTKKACSSCHDVHRKKPDCTQCHKPHAATMTAKDCSKCHRAHQPKNVVYPATIVNDECGACHRTAAKLLAATTSRHAKVACVQCHKEKHKTVPQCAECHQVKHPAGILAKFPNCLTCHNHPHDLNNFPPPAPAKKK